MNKTQQKILATSLEMFNKYGLEGVSIRDISNKLNISVGNLNYYYPTRNDIAHALCVAFMDRVDQVTAEELGAQSANLFEIAYRQCEAVFTAQLEYRFIFNKRYAEVVTSLPSIQKYYQEKLKERFNDFAAFQRLLVKEKLARPQLCDDGFSVTYIMNMLVVFWHQETGIYFPGLNDKQKVEHALSVFFHAYKPYLTQKGLDQLMPLLKRLKQYSPKL